MSTTYHEVQAASRNLTRLEKYRNVTYIQKKNQSCRTQILKGQRRWMSRQELENSHYEYPLVLKENMNTVSKEIGRSVTVLLLYTDNFIYFWLHWVLTAARLSFSWHEWGLFSTCGVRGFTDSLSGGAWTLRHAGLSSFLGSQVLSAGSVVVATQT